MGKVEETNLNLFYYVAKSANSLTDEYSAGISSLNERDLVSGNSDACKGILFFEQGKNTRISLFFKNNQTNENSAIGGGSGVTVNSSPEELVKDSRVRAMLDTIAYAEGTGNNYGRVVYGTVLGASDRRAPFDRLLVGKRNVVVNDFRRHPNLAVRWANGQPPSSAAGRYQFLYSTWNGLNMPNFSPRSQDIAAVKLMQRRGMIEPLLRGDFTGAIHKGAPEWASLPISGGGSYYGGQGAKILGDLRNVFGSALRRHQGTQPPPKSSTNTNEILNRGERGRAVESLQNKLIHLGLMTEAQKKTGPGIFGPRTEESVKKFQKNIGIKQSGRLDNATRQAMNKILDADIKKGASGDLVRRLQANLVRLGYMTRAQVRTGPGIFGPRTDAALKRFQADHNLTGDGIFGAKTFRAMQSAKPKGNNGDNTTKSPPTNGLAKEYKRGNVYSTGERPARLADGYEDLQAHHDYHSVNYVMRGLALRHRLEARDIVLSRPGQSNFGQPVPSPIEGKVLFAGDENDGYGSKVVIRNEKNGQIVLLGHLQSVDVRRGQTVSYGQNLGGQGSTGNSTGAHIHINADQSVIKRWVADIADGKFDGSRERFDIGRRP